MPRDPVVRAEEPARENAEPLEQPVAGAVAVRAVQLRQVVDVEEDHRDAVVVPQRPQRLLLEHEIEHVPGDERRQLIAQRVLPAGPLGEAPR